MQITNNELKELRSKHPLYEDTIEEWLFFLSAYEGGKKFASRTNLSKHSRENDQDFADRASRLHNTNYCDILVDFFTNFIFSEPIHRDGKDLSDFFDTFVQDVSRKGEGIEEFMRLVSDDMQIFGTAYVLVDAPRKPDNVVISKADEQTLGIRPYWVLLKPYEVLNWVVDDFGVYQYFKFLKTRDALIDGKRVTYEVYTEITPLTYSVTTLDASSPVKPVIVSKETFSNELGRIPVGVAKYKESKSDPTLGLSFLRDFAYNQKEILNLTSLLQEFLYRQAFNILVREQSDTVPMAEQEAAVIGTSNLMEVPKGAKFPQYVSPASDPAAFIQTERDRLKNEMFTRAAQDVVNELFNGEGASGFSRAQSFSRTVPFIESRADVLEKLENVLMQFTAELTGREWHGKIKYKDRYEITNITDALTQLLMIFKDFKVPSETFVKEELKRIIAEFDDKLTPETIAKIGKEIDSMDFVSWQQSMDAKSSSPGEQQKDKNTGTMAEAAAEAGMNSVGATNNLKG